MEVLFGFGIAFDIAGAALLVVPIWTMPRRTAGMVFPESGPTREALREVAYTQVGFVLLGIGFAIQLLGYVLQADDWGLPLAVVALAFVAFVVGKLVADEGAVVLYERHRPRLVAKVSAGETAASSDGESQSDSGEGDRLAS